MTKQLVIHVDAKKIIYAIYSDQECIASGEKDFENAQTKVNILEVIRQIEEDWSTCQRLKITSSIELEGPSMFGGLPLERPKLDEAWGRGGLPHSPSKKCLVVDMGYSTRFILADRKSKHYEAVSTSGLGIGTIEGLGKLLAQTAKYDRLEQIARSGQIKQVNITNDNQEGIVSSHFGQLVKSQFYTQSDIIAAIFDLIVQNVRNLADMTAGCYGLEEIIWAGPMLDSSIITNSLQKQQKTNYIFPQNPTHLPLEGAAGL